MHYRFAMPWHCRPLLRVLPRKVYLRSWLHSGSWKMFQSGMQYQLGLYQILLQYSMFGRKLRVREWHLQGCIQSNLSGQRQSHCARGGRFLCSCDFHHYSGAYRVLCDSKPKTKWLHSKCAILIRRLNSTTRAIAIDHGQAFM